MGKCAQCHGNHTSTNLVCPVVKQYKHELKLAVDTALKDTSNELNRKCILAIIDSLQSISKWTQASNAEKAKLKKRISKSVEGWEKSRRQSSLENDTSMRSTNESSQPPANINTISSIIATNNVSSNNLDRQNAEEDP